MSDVDGWLLELRAVKSPQTVKIQLEDRASVGRADKMSGTMPQVDLTSWKGLELGVAPEHVTIFTHGQQLSIIDLGSGKPTLLDERPLLVGTPRPLLDGARLQLGALEIDVRILAAPAGVPIPVKPATEPPAAAAPLTGQPVLVVEDEPQTAEIFRLIMDRAGYTPYICHEVVSAIRYLNVQTPSAIILDLMLPDIHGLELCRYVRRDINQRDIPIIVVSAGVTRQNIINSIEAGADVFLGKPVAMKELVRVVGSLVRWHQERLASLKTRRLDGTDTLRAMPADVRHDTLVLFVNGHEEPVAIVVPERITLGRRGGGYVPRPHVDLDRYGAFEAGVSRVHAAIHHDAGGFYVEDLESSNGTRLDEVKLTPGERLPIPNGAELTLGSLRLRVFYLTDDEDEPLSEEGGAAAS